jgi:hypothetical protein
MPTRQLIRIASALIVAVAMAVPASADLRLSQMVMAPRALAMGSATTAMRNELEVALGNPAGLSQLGRSGLTGAASVSGDVDFFGVGYLGTDPEEGRQYAFTFLNMDDKQLGFESKVAGGSVAMGIDERLTFGTTLKWLFTEPPGGPSDDHFTADVGLQYLVSPESSRSAVVGVVLSNIFSETLAGVDPGTQFSIGAQGKFSDEVLVAADVTDLFNSGPAGAVFRAGVEVEFGGGIILRAGLNDGDGSLGAGIESGKTRFEVGWRNDTVLRDEIVTVGASSSF